MAIKKVRAQKRVVTKKRATLAAKKAKKRYSAPQDKRPAAWRKGGREWTRVLGHFGLTA
jgi:hypothetical protein